MCDENDFRLAKVHPRRPRGGQSGWEKRRDERFQGWAEETVGADSYQTMSKRSSELCIIVRTAV